MKILQRTRRLHSYLQHLYMIFPLTISATVITGYRIRDGVWTLLGKGDPQAPQVIFNYY